MNISYRWLESLIPGLEATPEEVADRLASYGAPVDELLRIGGEIEDIVVARVEHVERHPNADRLSLCTVDAGTGSPLQVVCGAPNVRAGRYYPFAPVGAGLPGGIRIRKSKIRGVESQGMLCSERELGLGRGHEGIMELHGDFTPGEAFVPALGLDDVRIVVDVTPNRSDLLSHVGIARELAPGGNAGVRLPEFADASAGVRLERGADSVALPGVKVTLEDPRGCPRYLGAVVRGVTIGPSPAWLEARIRAVGLRPINNVVDATNYILYELGQPLHAFDLARLAGGEVRIRRARAGEKIVTLDGVERVLSEDMVVIADASDPTALAGVMGGEASEVTAETRDIFLECALFDPGITRRTRNAVGLSTDASYRYERGVDPEGMETALRRALDLIVAVAGGEVDDVVADLYPEPRPAPVVPITASRTTRLLGVPFTPAQIADLLEPLGFALESSGDDELRFRVPGYRSYDVSREADLIEEVARRYGYDSFPAELRPFRPSAVPDDPLAGLESRLRTLMVGQGFAEARLAAFVPESAGVVAPLNPLSSAESRLRGALLPGLLRRVEANFAHGARAVRLFEIGTVFGPGESPESLPHEETRLAFVVTGPAEPPHWSAPSRAADIWDLKGLLATLVAHLSADLALEPGAAEGTPLAAGRAFRVVASDGSTVGWGGEIDGRAIEAPVWADHLFGAEVVLRDDFVRPKQHRFQPLPAYPAIERDVALIVPETLAAATVEATIRAAGGRLLEDVTIFDLFRGAGIPEGARSIAYRLRFRSPERTLTDNEADKALDRVLKRLQEELGVTRRG